MKDQKTNDTSGFVQINGDNVEWHQHGERTISFDLDEIVVVGEYTTDAGPWFDDWFMVFVTKQKGG